MQKRKGNVSILVLFVLVATSLLGVLTMNFIQQMLYASGNIFSYYKSYYLANAGLELLHAQSQQKGIGWENEIFTGNTLVSQNFDCENCDISAKIISTTSGCKQIFSLSPGESLSLPLFKDIGTGEIMYQNLSSALSSMEIAASEGVSDQSKISIGLIILENNELYGDGIFFRPSTLHTEAISEFKGAFESYASNIEHLENSFVSLSQNYTQENYPFLNYLIIANTDEEVISFCISSEVSLPSQQLLINSNGRFGNQTLGLELIAPQHIPSFLLQSYLN